MFRALLCPS